MLRRPRRHCPRCRQTLTVSRDMWGEFYICEDCGFAEDDDLDHQTKTAALLIEEELQPYGSGFALERR